MGTKGKKKKDRVEDSVEVKGDDKVEQKAKKNKKGEKPVVVTVSHPKASTEKSIVPATGTRFSANSSQQLALEMIIDLASNGKNVKEIKEALGKTRKENGAARNLDAGYFNFVVASHPEMFQVKSDGTVKVVSRPKVDKKAVAEAEQKEQKRKSLSEKAKSEQKAGKVKDKSASKKKKKGKNKETLIK
jgi:DNA-binding transcriptional MerR regulator